MVCVSSTYLGTQKHLQADGSGSFSWVNKPAPGEWTWGFEKNPQRSEELIKIFGAPSPDLVPEYHKKAMETVLSGQHVPIPWHYVLKKADYETRLKLFLNDIQDVVRALEDSGYSETYIKTRAFIKTLSRSLIDKLLLDKYISEETNPTLVSILGSFRPSDDGFSRRCDYSLSNTRTGRATIIEGPQILTLPAKYRDILCPTRKHVLVQLDFVSLEPRVSLGLAGIKNIPSDIYHFINEKLFNNALTRSQIKMVTLCALYGISATKLSEIMSGNNCETVIRELKDFFSVPSQLKAMKNQLSTNGFLQNYFGRPLFFEEDSEHLLFSHFVQSTAVDIALMGFSHLQKLMQMEGVFIRPIFIIHDALILETRWDDIDKIKHMCQKGINIDGIGNFPLSFQILKKSHE